MNNEHGRPFGADPLHLEDQAADRVLQGEQDVPASYQQVAELLATLGDVKGSSTEEPGFVASLAAAAAAGPQESERSFMVSSVTKAKVGAVAAVVALAFSGGAAAAATGTLPSPVQTFVAASASKANIDLPTPEDKTTTTLSPTPVADDTPSSSVPTTSTTLAAPVVSTPPTTIEDRDTSGIDDDPGSHQTRSHGVDDHAATPPALEDHAHGGATQVGADDKGGQSGKGKSTPITSVPSKATTPTTAPQADDDGTDSHSHSGSDDSGSGSGSGKSGKPGSDK